MIARDSAVQALGGCKLKDRKIDRALAQRLEDKSWIVRCSAAYALGERRALHYTQRIVDRYRSWSFIEKKWVLKALAKMKDPATLDFLTRIYKRSSNRDRKYFAAAGLSVLGVNEPRMYLESKYAGTTDPEEKYTLEDCMDLVREAEIAGA
jgi:HEAT repeat protein